MDKTEQSRLRNRWSESQLADLNSRLGQFAFRKYVPSSRFTTDGLSQHGVQGRQYFDLRGLTISAMVNWLELDHIDFTAARFTGAGQFGPHARFSHCLFISGRFDTNIRDHFHACDFSRSMMVGAVLGASFISCTFDSTDLRRSLASTKFEECMFESVNFRAAILSGCQFSDCSFTSCRFGHASLDHCTFLRCALNEHDLHDAILTGTSIDDRPA